jgi:hypothetical protein
MTNGTKRRVIFVAFFTFPFELFIFLKFTKMRTTITIENLKDNCKNTLLNKLKNAKEISNIEIIVSLKRPSFNYNMHNTIRGVERSFKSYGIFYFLRSKYYNLSIILQQPVI